MNNNDDWEDDYGPDEYAIPQQKAYSNTYFK